MLVVLVVVYLEMHEIIIVNHLSLTVQVSNLALDNHFLKSWSISFLIGFELQTIFFPCHKFISTILTWNKAYASTQKIYITSMPTTL